MQMLNVGCGRRFCAEWVNVDFVSGHPSVLRCDVRHGLPFSDMMFDAVYHSHVLEHFTQKEGLKLLRECRRVLKPSGVIRVVVPDLEELSRLYLQTLEAALGDDKDACRKYDWIVLELFDQMVRERSGGRMREYIEHEVGSDAGFALSRMGAEGHEMVQAMRRTPKVKEKSSSRLIRVLRGLGRIVREWAVLREVIARRTLGSDYELLQIGRFRRSGEVHLSMYDRFSLARALIATDFRENVVVGPRSSRIPNWGQYNLDCATDGSVHRPGSLYMEAIK